MTEPAAPPVKPEDRNGAEASAADADHPNASTPEMAPDARLGGQRNLPLWAGAGVVGAIALGAILYLAM